MLLLLYLALASKVQSTLLANEGTSLLLFRFFLIVILNPNLLRLCWYYHYYPLEHSAFLTAVATYPMLFHLFLSSTVLIASVIVSPRFSLIAFIILVFCRPLDLIPTTIPFIKSFSMHLCLIIRKLPITLQLCCKSFAMKVLDSFEILIQT